MSLNTGAIQKCLRLARMYEAYYCRTSAFIFADESGICLTLCQLYKIIREKNIEYAF